MRQREAYFKELSQMILELASRNLQGGQEKSTDTAFLCLKKPRHSSPSSFTLAFFLQPLKVHHAYPHSTGQYPLLKVNLFKC